MIELLTNNWMPIAAGACVLAIVSPYLGGVAKAVGRFVPAFGKGGKPSQDDLVHAYRLLLDNLSDDQATKAMRDHVWPAIGGYRP